MLLMKQWVADQEPLVSELNRLVSGYKFADASALLDEFGNC